MIDPERRERVLAALASAGPQGVAGPELAALLGCSRAAVHRHVEALRRGGIEVHAGRRGYRLAGEPDLVVSSLVEPRLRPPLAGPVVWRESTASTNDEAIRRAREGAAEGLVVGAEHQTAGRGRRGRSWVAAAGDALLFSVVLRPPVAPVDAAVLPIVAAVALAEALGDEAGIVWPNDLLIGGRKVGGILCELSSDESGIAWAVVGIGINVRSAPRLDEGRWTPGALADLGHTVPRAELLVAVLRSLAGWYARWVHDGAGPVLTAFAARDLLRGRGLTVEVGGRRVAGSSAGLDELGRLRLVTAAGELALGAGEVVRVE